MPAGRFRELPQGPLLTFLLSLFILFSLELLFLALFGLPSFVFFPLAFVKILGRCLQTLLLCLHPALLAQASSLFCFPARPRKTKTQHWEPPPAGACASSPLAMAQLLVHTAAKASSTFLPPSPHFTGDGALDAEEGPQLHGLPKSTGSLLTKNGETRFHLVC